MFKIGTKNYYLDLDRINDWILNNPLDNKSIETNTSYDHKGDMVNIVKTEFENSSQQAAMRENLITDMLQTLYNSGAESDAESIKYIQQLENLSIGHKIIFNTFIENEFIINKE